MTEKKKLCGDKKGKETCSRELGHVGMHNNGGSVTWKGPKAAKPEPAKEPSLTDKCPPKTEVKPIDAVFALPKGKPEKEADPVEERVYALIVAEPGIPTEQIPSRHKKALHRLEGAGRIELLRGGWVPSGANGDGFDRVWKSLSGIGVCDEIGGLEYERVRAEYFAAGSPPAVDVFIRRRANADSDGNDAQVQEADEPDDLEMRTLARRHREAHEAHAAEVESAAPSGPLKVHPAADILPLIEGEPFEAFVEDIRVNGLRKKIVLDHAGEWLVDGRNRKRACERLGKPLEFERLPEGANIEAYIISENLTGRRHMDDGARAMCASEIANLSQGQKQTRPGAGQSKGITQAEAAAAAGVGLRTVQRANAVRDKGVPELVAAVKAGKVDLKGAEQVAKLSPSEQRKLIKERVDTSKTPVRAGKLAAVARQEEKRAVVRAINTGKVRPMPSGQFGVIYGDYPWLYENSDQHEGSRGHMAYPGMPMPDILAHAREAAKRAGKDCVIALWFTNAFLHEIGNVLAAYGAKQHTAFTWDKATKNDKDKKGVGSWGRGQTEHLVIASIGKPVHTLNEVDTLIRAAVREPGRKPEVFAELLQKHCSGPFLELFGRAQRENWEVWGAETNKYDGKAA